VISATDESFEPFQRFTFRGRHQNRWNGSWHSARVLPTGLKPRC